MQKCFKYLFCDNNRNSQLLTIFYFFFFFVLIFFFFQAEGGIRDVAVTGVQTCALPICHYYHNVLSLELLDTTGKIHAITKMDEAFRSIIGDRKSVV